MPTAMKTPVPFSRQATRQIPVVLPTNHLQMPSERRLDLGWQHGHAVSLPLPVAEKQFATREVDIFHMQFQRPEQT